MKLIATALTIYLSTLFCTSSLSCSDLDDQQKASRSNSVPHANKDTITGCFIPDDLLLKGVLPNARIKVVVGLELTCKRIYTSIHLMPELWENKYHKIPGSELFPLRPLAKGEDKTIYSLMKVRTIKHIIAKELRTPFQSWTAEFYFLNHAGLSGNGVVTIGTTYHHKQPSYFHFDPAANKPKIKEVQDHLSAHSYSSAVDHSGQYIVTINEKMQQASIWKRGNTVDSNTLVCTLDNISHVKSIRTSGEEIILLGITKKHGHPQALKTIIRGNNIQHQLLDENPSYAWAMTPDTKTVVGSLSSLPQAPEQACIWQEDGEINYLGLFPRFKRSDAVGISTAGDIVIGNMCTTEDRRFEYEYGFFEQKVNDPLYETKAFIALKVSPEELFATLFRDKNDGFVVLPLESLIDLPNPVVHAMSLDSKRLVGRYKSDELSPHKPFIWDDWHNDIIDLEHLIKNLDLKLTTGGSVHIKPHAAISMSENGAVILIKGIQQDTKIFQTPLCSLWQLYLPRYDILEEQGINFTKLETLKTGR